MKGKRIILLGWCLVLVMMLSLALSGCGGTTNTVSNQTTAQTTTATEPAKPEPFNVSVFYTSPGQSPTPDNKIFKLMKEKFGVTFQFENVVGDKDQKLGVMIAGGDYPDLITGDTKLINAGAFIPLEDLIEKNAPNLKAHYGPYWNMVKEPKDGHFYVMPNYGRYYGKYLTTQFYGPCFFIQKAVLKEFGYPKIKSLDEYFDLIQKYKEKYPTIDGKPTIGFEILSEGWRNFCLKNAPQHLIGHPNDGNVVVDPQTMVAQIFADKDYAKRYYKKLNDMNASGLVDKETFTQNYDQYIAKLSSGRVLGMFDQRWNFGNAENALKTAKMIERTYAPCPVTFDGIKDYYMDRPPLNVNCGFGISIKCKDPVRIIKMFDALMTEEWQKIIQWGIKDEDYKVDDKGMYYLTPEQRKNGNDNAWKLANTASDFLSYCPKMEGTYTDGNACSAGYQPNEYYEGLDPYDKELLNAYGFKCYADFYSTPGDNAIYYPCWQINLIDGSPAKVADTKMNDLSSKYLPKAILAKPDQFEKVWGDYVNEFKKIDVKSYEDRINEQIQYRIKNWSVK